MVSLSTADIDTRLDAIAEHLDECRAAAATAAEGDPQALNDLHREVDALAEDVAALKAATRPPAL